MRKQASDVVSQFLASRAALLELLVGAIVLAIGVNIIASQALLVLDLRPGLALSLGVGLVVAALAFFAYRGVATQNFHQRFEGFILCDRSTNNLVSVERYPLGEFLVDDLRSVFTENPAIRALWDAEPLSRIWDVPKSPDVIEIDSAELAPKPSQAAALLTEAAEYFVLRQLSMTLAGYFYESREFVRTLKRNDIPDILLTNRVLELLSRPMEQRTSLAQQAAQRPSFGRVLRSESADGALYEAFELVLPRDAIVKRDDTGAISIETRVFRMRLRVRFDAFGRVLPRRFKRDYCGVADDSSVDCFAVEVEMHVAFRPFATLRLRGWHFYRWLDELVDALRNTISKDMFLSTIYWEAADTLLRCQARASASGTSPKVPAAGGTGASSVSNRED